MASDTSDAARRVQDGVYRAMTPEQRVELAVHMSEEVRLITLASIKSRDPSLSEAEAHHELLAVLHGRALADRLVGRRDR